MHPEHHGWIAGGPIFFVMQAEVLGMSILHIVALILEAPRSRVQRLRSILPVHLDAASDGKGA
jgi:hypothetical protein